MYDNSHVPSYTNASSRPCRTQYSRWSLYMPTTEAAISQPLPQSTATLSSSFYFPQSQKLKQVVTPNYVNYHPPLPPSSSSTTHLSNYNRSNSTKQSVFDANDCRPRCETKTIVGIVKPMVQQRSYTQSSNNDHSNKTSEIMLDSYHHNSTHSLLYRSPPASSHPPSVVYRSRPTPSFNNINAHPPIAPKRHSSISNSKSLSSRRSSRTTSTSSSIAAVNELSSTTSSSYENEQKQREDDKVIIDVKRLEMFYGSVGTLVKSARSIARLYITTTRQLANAEDWSCQQLGVPVWIYNTGANLKRARQVRLLLAHQESCFAVWSSLVSDQAELRLPKDNYITCWLPESNLLVVFKFEREDACRLFLRHYYEILEYERRTAVANSPVLSAGNTTQKSHQTSVVSNSKEIPRRYSRLRAISNKKAEEEQQQQFELRRCRSLSRIRTVKKSAISGPINFEHVNHISGSCQQERPLASTVTLRSLHASMSHLPNNSSLTDRFSYQNKHRASTLFEPHTTAV